MDITTRSGKRRTRRRRLRAHEHETRGANAERGGWTLGEGKRTPDNAMVSTLGKGESYRRRRAIRTRRR